MKIAASFANFAQATDESAMREFFVGKQDRFLATDDKILSVQISRVFPRGEESLSIQYRLRVRNRKLASERDLMLWGELSLGTASGNNGHHRHPERYLASAAMNLVIPIFPYDPKLKFLATLVNEKPCAEYLASQGNAFIWGSATPRVTAIELLGYRAERRAVLRIGIEWRNTAIGTFHSGAIIARIVRGDQLSAIVETQQAMRAALERTVSAASISAPRIDFVDTNNGVYFMEAVAGANLADMTAMPDFASGCRHAGELLSVVHSQTAESRTKYTAAQEFAELERKVKLVAAIFPALEEACRAELQRLSEALFAAADDAESALIHRDFYDKQILIAEDRIFLIDFDGVSEGDSAQDYGNFVAHCFLRQLQEPENAANIAIGAKEFVSGYGRKSANWKRRSAWWQAATFLRLAALYALRPRWRDISINLVHECNRVLETLNSGTRIKHAQRK